MKPPVRRFKRATVCEACVDGVLDEVLGARASFEALVCARCGKPLQSALVVQRPDTSPPAPKRAPLRVIASAS